MGAGFASRAKQAALCATGHDFVTIGEWHPNRHLLGMEACSRCGVLRLTESQLAPVQAHKERVKRAEAEQNDYDPD